ncbi:hypothetical protein L6273_02040 [Candidatus Parcubacteria bacterium]|nr:hypothetical protein [Candidatus Parcubacteria bacterium]
MEKQTFFLALASSLFSQDRHLIVQEGGRATSWMDLVNWETKLFFEM